MMAGADFIKTSTGKESVNATLDVSLVITNLVNAKDTLTQNANGGRGGCAVGAAPGDASTCARFTPYLKETTFRPRTIGITTRFRY